MNEPLRPVAEELARLTSRRRWLQRAAVEGLRGTQLKGRTVEVVIDRRPPGGRPGGRRRGKGRR